MDRKALLKTILVIVALCCYITVSCLAMETKNPVLIGCTVGPLILLGLIAIASVLYEYFKED